MKKWIRSSLAACAALATAGVVSLRAQDPAPNWDPGSNFQFVSMGQVSYIGVSLADIDRDRAQALKLRDVHGVEITRIEENSPAAKAGLKIGDVVLDYNGQRVEGMEQFGRFIRETPVGREVKVLISREGTQQSVAVTVAGRKDGMGNVHVFSGITPQEMREFRFNMPEINIPTPDIPQVFQSWRTAVLGVEAESLSSQLAEFFGVKDGVLVRSVLKDSPAEKAGIKAGDVITKVEQQTISSPAELSSAVRMARSKTTFPVQIFRERRELTMNVTVDRAKSDAPSAPHTRVVSTHQPKM